MSREQDYFPPQGTKWEWSTKALNYSPWVCDLCCQREPGLFLHPLAVTLYVDKIEGRWKWFLRSHDFRGKKTELWGMEDDPLKACLAAEKEGEAILNKALPDWVRTALANGWRPPAP